MTLSKPCMASEINLVRILRLVGIAVAPAADAFHIAMVAQNILQQHNIHIDRAKVIFQNADIPALLNHIAGIVPHKSRFGQSQESR